MPKLDKIYTKGGDKGKSHLANGERRPKSDLHFAVCGSIDEANTSLGLLLCEALEPKLHTCFTALQHQLFDVGSDITCPIESDVQIPRITAQHVMLLEQHIDAFQKELTPLEQFILPGGNRAAALCHAARTQIRRAEREAWILHASEAINIHALQFLNRLSDFFFVCARRANINGSDDVYWQPGVMLSEIQPDD